MPDSPPNTPEQPLLTTDPAALPVPAPAARPADVESLPREELFAVAEDLGLEPRRYPTPQHVRAAVHERRQMIATLDRSDMVDVLQWAHRPFPASATKDQLAGEILRVTTMRFGGLSQGGLYVLARLRGADARPTDDIPALVRKLKRREGFFSKLNRKRRRLLGSLISSMIGEDDLPGDSSVSAPQPPPAQGPPAAPPRRPSTIKEDIEESGFFGGIAGRIRKSADNYVNQKLDEVEARIDRKLDEIDRRLSEWRDRELRNRLRILKITLWATVLVAAISLLYSYIVYLIRWVGGR